MDTPPYTATGQAVVPVGPGPALRRDQVYGELRRRLMEGEFPLQRRLVEERIAGALGVSRTPVREALLRLQADGLVHRHDGGYYVSLPDVGGLRDLYDVRIALEVRGIVRVQELAGQRHDPTVLEPLLEQWRELWQERPDPAPEFVALDEDFHVTLCRSSGNAVLADQLSRVNDRIRPVRMYDFLSAERIETTIAQHVGILERVLAGDTAAALDALRGHVGESLGIVERRAAQAITAMVLHRGGAE